MIEWDVKDIGLKGTDFVIASHEAFLGVRFCQRYPRMEFEVRDIMVM
jgi:hypothetical protein